METKLKVTNANDEVSFAEILSGDNVINIPLFQRSYRWSEKNFEELWSDVMEIVDGKVPAQFLGVLVTVPQPWQLGKPMVADVVDGQQRLTTCYLTCLALAEVLAENGNLDTSIEITKKLLLNRQFQTSQHNTKIVPAFGDRQQFSDIWAQYTNLVKKNNNSAWHGFGEPCPPTPSGPNDGPMGKQYKRIKRKVASLFKYQGDSMITDVLNAFASKLSFVTISLVDPSAAPKIFERLNARGERITTADLVRNEIFARVSDDPAKAQAIFSSRWEPFVKKFTDKEVPIDEYLFPYGLCHDPSTTKSDLFRTLRTRWNALSDISTIIDDLNRYTDTFFALRSGAEIQVDQIMKRRISCLFRMKAPSSTYPFVFRLIDALKNDEIDTNSGAEALQVVEDFLFRRAVCGIEPTGLHSVFKGLWPEIKESGLCCDASSVRKMLAKRTTVPWPDDEQFRNAVMYGDLYRRNIRHFAIGEFELASDGETPSDDFWIEHIMPQHLSKDWQIDAAVHNKWCNTWANLIPLTDSMNPSLGQKSFGLKVGEFKKSIFSTARNISTEYIKWEEEDIKKRAQMLADWAVERWINKPMID